MYTSLAFYGQFPIFNEPGLSCASRLFISSYINGSPKLAPFLCDARFHGRLLPRFCPLSAMSSLLPSCQKCFPEVYIVFFQLFVVESLLLLNNCC